MDILEDESPTIIHFSGHGESETGLIFTSASGYPQSVKGDVIADLLRDFELDEPCKKLIKNDPSFSKYSFKMSKKKTV